VYSASKWRRSAPVRVSRSVAQTRAGVRYSLLRNLCLGGSDFPETQVRMMPWCWYVRAGTEVVQLIPAFLVSLPSPFSVIDQSKVGGGDRMGGSSGMNS